MRAYLFAFDTTHAGVSDTPYTPLRVRQLRVDMIGITMAHQIQDLALHDEGMEAVHDLFDGGSVVPPVDVEEINVGSA